MPVPLAKATVAVALPEALLLALKKPLVELVLNAKETPLDPAVVLLPNWSTSWRPSATSVVVDTPAEAGVAARVTLTGVAPLIVSVCEPVWRPLAAAESVGEPAVVSP